MLSCVSLGQSELSYEEDDEEDNPRLRAVVQSVMTRNVQQKTDNIDDGGESSEDDGGADVVVNKDGIPMRRSVHGRVARMSEGMVQKDRGAEVEALMGAALTGAQNVSALQEAATDEDDDEEEEEDDEDEEVSSDNDEGSEGHHSQHHRHNKERERQLQMEAEKVIRQQRLTRQLMTSGPEGQSLVEVHEVEDEDEEEEDDEDEEEEELEEGKEVLPTKVIENFAVIYNYVIA